MTTGSVCGYSCFDHGDKGIHGQFTQVTSCLHMVYAQFFILSLCPVIQLHRHFRVLLRGIEVLGIRHGTEK